MITHLNYRTSVVKEKVLFVTGYGDNGADVIEHCEKNHLNISIMHAETEDLSYITLANPLKWRSAVSNFLHGPGLNDICNFKPDILIAHSLGTIYLSAYSFLLPFIPVIITTAGVADSSRPYTNNLINYFFPGDLVLRKLLDFGKIFSETKGMKYCPIGLLPNVLADRNIVPNLEISYASHNKMKLIPLINMYGGV